MLAALLKRNPFLTERLFGEKSFFKGLGGCGVRPSGAPPVEEAPVTSALVFVHGSNCPTEPGPMVGTEEGADGVLDHRRHQQESVLVVQEEVFYFFGFDHS